MMVGGKTHSWGNVHQREHWGGGKRQPPSKGSITEKGGTGMSASAQHVGRRVMKGFPKTAVEGAGGLS